MKGNDYLLFPKAKDCGNNREFCSVALLSEAQQDTDYNYLDGAFVFVCRGQMLFVILILLILPENIFYFTRIISGRVERAYMWEPQFTH